MDVAAVAMAVKRLIDPATYVSSHVSTEKRSHRTTYSKDTPYWPQ